MVNDVSHIITSFDGILKSFAKGDDYRKSPPQGPPDELPSLTNEELQNLQRTVFGEDLANTGYSYKSIKLVEEPAPVSVALPNIDDLAHINICGIDGSSQRVERSTFYFIMARAAVVEFRYSISNQKPYFYNKFFDRNAVLWVDGNVFTEEIKLHTEILNSDRDGNANILNRISSANTSMPFLVKHDPEKINKSPSSHALGWAVKLQQALELACIKEIPTNIESVCIKDGPLFSTSVSPQDTIDGLNPIFQWQNQVLIACSKRIKDSSLLVEALQRNVELRNYWFPDQNITDQTLKLVSTDSILLPRILLPGYRTPLMEAVPVARQKVVSEDGGEPGLTPLSCYYLSKHQPHTYIRIEIPRFLWMKDKDRVLKAISIVAWQHELGHKAPLVQLAADLRCQLGYEKNILEKQTISYLYRNNLDFPVDC